MRQFRFKLTDRQFDKLFGVPAPYLSDPDEMEYENFAVVTDINVLRKLQKQGFVTFHEKTGQMVEHWASQWVRAFFVKDVCDEGGFCFHHKDDRIFVTTRYFDGCDCPIVVMGRGPTEDEARDHCYCGAPAYV